MSYAPTWFVLGLMGVIASVGCFFGDAPAPESPGVDLQATINAALARVAAAQETDATPTTVPLRSTAAPTAPPDNVPSPQVIAVTPKQTQPPTMTATPPEFRLSDARNWDYAEQTNPAVIAQIRSIGWIADGLQTADEFNAAERMVNLGIDTPETLNAILDSHELRNGLRPTDLPALLSLQRMAQHRPERLRQLHEAPWFRDGWTDAEAAIVAILFDRSIFLSPEFDDIVANPGLLNIDFGSTTNRVGEEVPIAIVRPGPVPDGSAVMAVAQSAVSVFEELFDARFPTPAIVIHVTEYVVGTAGGTNEQTHITLLPEIDENIEPDSATHLIFHEIAHYYLYAEPTWYSEGGADFAASYALWATTGTTIESTNGPCATVSNLAELESRSPEYSEFTAEETDLWRCNYYLGERLLLALHRYLGEERFLSGWRELYVELERDPSYPSQRELTETDIRVAWLRAGGMSMQPELELIWDQWYRGRASRVMPGVPDPSPADPSLPGINGRIDQAYVALTTDGPPVDSFSASDVDGRVYLTLKYSYSLSGSSQDLTLELAEYFEDGFSNGRRTVPVTLQPQHIGGTQWLSVGPTAPLHWAPGRYWVYVYEAGRKVAEVQFDVTP